jgi:hypothetical protein
MSTDRGLWHRTRAHECSWLRDWYGAAWHLDRLATGTTTDLWVYETRAQANAELGHFDRAAPDFAAAVCLGSPPGRTWLHLALTSLAEGHVDEYRSLCRRAVAALLSGQLRQQASTDVARLLLLAPDGLDEDERGPVLNSLRRQAAAGPKNDPPAAATMVTFFLVRIGRGDRALADLERLEKEAAGHPRVRLFLALAHLQMDQKNEARDWLKKAQLPRDFARTPSLLTWDDVLEIRLLTDEVTRRLER